MFAYCCNNPVTREDPDGEAFDTVFDILSLGASIADVISNPRDPWAWAGLAGDVIDVAVPFVTGVGEVTRAAKVAKETAEVVDDAHDAMKTVCAFGDAACFIAGTLVSVEDGHKAIEDVEAGDYVWAWDEETGEVALKQVVETYVRTSDKLIHIFVNGEEIITTPDHPFYAPVKGWTDAANLRAGDILVLVNGEYVIVEKVQHEILEAPVTVYNFQVEDFHTYFVGNSGVLVHNDCETTLDFLRRIDCINGNYYADPETIATIGKIEASGEDFSLLNRSIQSQRDSTEGGFSTVYKYIDNQGTKYLIHEVTDANELIIHRDFDAVRIMSGQIINKKH